MKRSVKQKLRSGDEYDAICKAPLCVFKNNTGLRKFYKRVLNRRLRRAWRNEVVEGD